MAFYRRVLHVLCLFVLILSTSAVADPRDLDEAERILSEAGSLGEFLSNPVLQDRYRVAMQRYLHPRSFSDEEFQARMDFLRKILSVAPELETRLWTVDSSGESFQLDSESTTFAKEVNTLALTRYHWSWRQRYLVEATPYAVKSREQLFPIGVYANKARSVLDAAIQDHQNKVAKLTSKTAKINADKKFYAEFRDRKDYRELRSFIMRRFLSQETQQDLFRMVDADAMLKELQSWRDDPVQLAPDILFPGSPILRLLRDEIPTVAQLLGAESEGEKLFTPKLLERMDGKKTHASKSGTLHWVSRPVPRRLHAIFSPCIHRECVSQSPERWLVPAMSGSRFWYIERNGEVTGSGQLVPIVFKSDPGKTYASLDLSSPDFALEVLVSGNNSGLVKTSIFNRWLAFAQKSLPNDWAGIVVGSSTEGDNGLSLRNAIHPSGAYGRGTEVGRGVDVLIRDSIVAPIIERSPKTHFSGRMTFDAVLPGNRLVPLKRLAGATDEYSVRRKEKTAGVLDWEKHATALLEQLSLHEFVDFLKRHQMFAEEIADCIGEYLVRTGTDDFRRVGLLTTMNALDRWSEYVGALDQWEPISPAEDRLKELIGKNLSRVPFIAFLSLLGSIPKTIASKIFWTMRDFHYRASV